MRVTCFLAERTPPLHLRDPCICSYDLQFTWYWRLGGESITCSRYIRYVGERRVRSRCSFCGEHRKRREIQQHNTNFKLLLDIHYSRVMYPQCTTLSCVFVPKCLCQISTKPNTVQVLEANLTHQYKTVRCVMHSISFYALPSNLPPYFDAVVLALVDVLRSDGRCIADGCDYAGDRICDPFSCCCENTMDGRRSPNSRWSCKGGGCCITYYFSLEPQDIVIMRIAFHKGDERTRTLDVYDNGDHHSEITSSGNTLGYERFYLNTVDTEEIKLCLDGDEDEWLSITEVRWKCLEPHTIRGIWCRYIHFSIHQTHVRSWQPLLLVCCTWTETKRDTGKISPSATIDWWNTKYVHAFTPMQFDLSIFWTKQYCPCGLLGTFSCWLYRKIYPAFCYVIWGETLFYYIEYAVHVPMPRENVGIWLKRIFVRALALARTSRSITGYQILFIGNGRRPKAVTPFLMYRVATRPRFGRLTRSCFPAYNGSTLDNILVPIALVCMGRVGYPW